MAFNPSQKVAVARDIAKQFKKNQVIVIMLDDNHRLHCASYGATKALCADAKKLADVAFKAIDDELWRL